MRKLFFFKRYYEFFHCLKIFFINYRQREGYPEGDFTLFHSLKASEFINSDNYLNLLAQRNEVRCFYFLVFRTFCILFGVWKTVWRFNIIVQTTLWSTFWLEKKIVLFITVFKLIWMVWCTCMLSTAVGHMM